MSNPACLAASIVREISVAASADPRSVRAVWKGGRLRTMADARVRRALAERGYLVPVPLDDGSPILIAPLGGIGAAR